jgi:hypothetical protein
MAIIFLVFHAKPACQTTLRHRKQTASEALRAHNLNVGIVIPQGKSERRIETLWMRPVQACAEVHRGFVAVETGQTSSTSLGPPPMRILLLDADRRFGMRHTFWQANN